MNKFSWLSRVALILLAALVSVASVLARPASATAPVVDYCPIANPPSLPKLKNIVVKFHPRGIAEVSGDADSRAIKKRLEEITHEIAKATIKPEYGLTLYEDYLPEEKQQENLETIFITIWFFGHELESQASESGRVPVAIIDPVVKTTFSCTALPFDRKELPYPILLSEDWGRTYADYRDIVTRSLEARMRELVCLDEGGKQKFSLCKKPLGLTDEMPSKGIKK